MGEKWIFSYRHEECCDVIRILNYQELFLQVFVYSRSMFIRKGKFVRLNDLKARFHSFLTSALDVGERSASHLGRFNHRSPSSSSLGGPQRRSGPFGEDKILLLLSGMESRDVQPLAESLNRLRHLESTNAISILWFWTLVAEDRHRTKLT
jgi:hypothetical protein